MIKRLTKVPRTILRRIIQEGLDEQYNWILRREGFVMSLMRMNTFGTGPDDDASTEIEEINQEVRQQWEDLIDHTHRQSLIRFFRTQRTLFHMKKYRLYLRLIDTENETRRHWQLIERLRQENERTYNLQRNEPENEERKE